MSVYDKNLKSLQSKYKKLEESLWDTMKNAGKSLFKGDVKVDITDLIGEPPATWKELEQLETKLEYALNRKFPGKKIDVAIFGDSATVALPADMKGMEEKVRDIVAQIATNNM